MPSPSSCARCSLPLPADSGERLCPSCLASDETPGLPPATPGSIDPAADATATVAPPPATETGSLPLGGFWVGLPPAPAGYKLIRELGHGGMGDVYLAWEQVAERQVAMKFLRSRGNPAGVDRFLTEVRALARVEHDHIVKVLATDFQRADPFFTMPCVPGGNLARRVEEKGPLDPKAAAGLLAAVARAVQAAHAAGVLHRDLKPSNILLAADGSPRVSDFGLAKLTDRDGITDPSGAIGTPGFMPPEQVSRRHGAVGPAADVYGLGATLYYLVTGRPPFVGDTKEEVVTRVVNDQPALLRTACPGVPAGLEAVVMKCLEKRPADRYATAAELAGELEKCAKDEAPVTPPLTRVRRLRRWVRRNRGRLAAGAGVVLLAVGLVVAFGPWRDPLLTAEQVRRKLRAGETVTLVGPDGTVRVRTAWAIGPGELVPSLLDGTACSFQTRETMVLALTADPGVASFRIRADLRQDKKIGDADGVSADTGKVGLAIGHSRTPLGGGAGVHALWLVGFGEYPSPPPALPPDRRITLYDLAVFDQPLQTMWHQQIHGPTVRLRSPTDAPRPWRPVEVDVGPAGVVVRHAGQEAVDQAARLDRRRGDLEAKARAGWAHEAPLALPRWGAPTSVGIFASSCWVSARNVTIEPLPLGVTQLGSDGVAAPHPEP